MELKSSELYIWYLIDFIDFDEFQFVMIKFFSMYVQTPKREKLENN